LPRIGFVVAGGILATTLNAVIGAVILLLVIGLLRRAGPSDAPMAAREYPQRPGYD